jgi:diguanylate cyclase (GGDEF)-like protein
MQIFRSTLRTRIYFVFGVLVALGLGVAGFGTLELWNVTGSIDKMNAISGNVLRAEEAARLLEVIRRAADAYHIDADRSSLNTMKESEAQLAAVLADAANATLSQKRGSLYNGAGEMLRTFVPYREAYVRASDAGFAARAKLFTGGDNLTAATDRLIEASRAGPDLAVLDAAEHLNSAILSMRVANWRFLATGDPRGVATFATSASNADATMAALERVDGDKVKALVKPLRDALMAYKTGFEEVSTSFLEGAEILDNRIRPQIIAMQRTLGAALESLNADFVVGVVASRDDANRVMLVQSIVASVAAAFGVTVAFLIKREIVRPIVDMTQALSELAAGNREIRVPEVHRSDEIGEMAKAFEVFRINALALEQAHEATRVAEEQAHALARHDPLTGLPNRRVFSAELQTALSRAQTGAATYSVLLIDLDHFKQINDLQGHSVGDTVLCEVARRLKEIVRTTDTVARLGGDEFAIIAEGEAEQQAHLDGARRLASKVLGGIREPILDGETRMEINASIGIASCRADEADAAGLLHAADVAMYRAKRDGRGTFRFFDQSMDEDLRAQAALEMDLKLAVAEGKIRPYYQPLVDLRTNCICGFEALARWDHPERGFVPPDVFIPLVEQLGLMTAFTSSILRQACQDARRWAEDVRLSVNISPSDLKDPLLPSRLFAILAEEGFPPARLDVEIVETALVSDIQTAKSILTTLQSLGIKVCLDDFGTGYSSLYHLRELKFDKIKIDRSFVQAMQNNSESEKIVDAILGLTKSLGLPTVAEGVENPAALRALAAKGCEFGQGYYFGKAMTADSAGALLNSDDLQDLRVQGEPSGSVARGRPSVQDRRNFGGESVGALRGSVGDGRMALS